MNRENIQKVRDHIASLPPERYDQTNWTTGCNEPEELMHTCGTAGCIAGWAIALFPKYEWGGRHGGDYETRAGAILGVNSAQAAQLFRACPRGLKKLMPEEAARVLDHLLETGKVDWSIIDTVSA